MGGEASDRNSAFKTMELRGGDNPDGGGEEVLVIHTMVWYPL